ncbi:MAG: histidine phosphatase family protein [Parachlamydia sp.]|nr:histidine phosphatase family protein [Parachlamydia sp.]
MLARLLLLATLATPFHALLDGLPAQVIIIRHGEKPSKGNGLSLKGEQRADALVAFFQGNAEVLQFGVPAAIFAEQPESDGKHERPLLTITPLSDALNLVPNTSFSKKDITGLTDEIKNNTVYEDKMVLICWEHKEIPSIAATLGANSAPSKWSGKVYDRVWLITYDTGKSSTKTDFANLPQQLLYGDSTH